MNAEPSAPVSVTKAPFLPGTLSEKRIFLVLLGLATLLRCWDLAHLPYTHDEISALLRMYPSLSETIARGVIELDTHPPGVQVFEWSWTQLFGMAEWVVKLPFILCSLAALFLLYRFAYARVGGPVALIATAWMATLQYTVMYGQIARPYAMGFFTIALLADQLTRYLERPSRATLIGTVSAAVLSGYVHHFSLMLAALMMLTGLLQAHGKVRRNLLIGCAAGAVLFLPNIPILLHQLGHGGLQDWLQPPGPDWIPSYLWWIAHCSVLMAVVWSVSIITALMLRLKHRHGSRYLWTIAGVWGMGPLLIGYLYSVHRAPVLQYSMLLFSFPFLLIPVLAGLRHLPGRWLVPTIATIVVCSVATLVHTRQHYTATYRSRYETIVRGILEARTTDRLALVECPERVVRFYLQHWHADTDAAYVNTTGLDAAAFNALLAGERAELFYGTTAGASPEHLVLAQRAYPFLLQRQDRIEGRSFVFRSSPDRSAIDDIAFERAATPQAVDGQGWRTEGLPLLKDTASGPYPSARRWDLGGLDFATQFEMSLDSLAPGPNDLIEGFCDGEGDALRMVIELNSGDSTLVYRASDAAGHGRSRAAVAIDLSDVPRRAKDIRVKAYLWNAGSPPAQVSSVAIRVREGNTWQYGATAPIPGPNRYP
ncbi:MAG TPA: glycosyltransferase family 39 protein [Flavobacteriales bacterium]